MVKKYLQLQIEAGTQEVVTVSAEKRPDAGSGREGQPRASLCLCTCPTSSPHGPALVSLHLQSTTFGIRVSILVRKLHFSALFGKVNWILEFHMTFWNPFSELTM